MVDWEKVFDGADWFHWTGITPAISQGAADACLEAIQMANKMFTFPLPCRWKRCIVLITPKSPTKARFNFRTKLIGLKCPHLNQFQKALRNMRGDEVGFVYFSFQIDWD